MKSYGSISSTFSPQSTSFIVDWNRCVANRYQAMFYPHCAAVQAFIIDFSVIGSIAVFTLLVVTPLALAIFFLVCDSSVCTDRNVTIEVLCLQLCVI
jgi:hypothetical protein